MIPVVLLTYGKRLRKGSKFAQHSIKVYNANSADGTRAGSIDEVVGPTRATFELVVSDASKENLVVKGRGVQFEMS